VDEPLLKIFCLRGGRHPVKPIIHLEAIGYTFLQLLKVSAVAKLLSVNPATVRNWIRRGELRAKNNRIERLCGTLR
jgi:hypothetical protein